MTTTEAEQNAILVALVAYHQWQWSATTLTAKALREALDALGLHGPLAACFSGIVMRAEGAIAKAERGSASPTAR
jgi:hypothetical protein